MGTLTVERLYQTVALDNHRVNLKALNESVLYVRYCLFVFVLVFFVTIICNGNTCQDYIPYIQYFL